MRILETYNFENQTTYGINGQIKTATLLSSNKLAIANDTYIEIFDIDERVTGSSDQNRNPNKYYFATFGDIHELIFCKAGNYLLSLENFASFGDNSSSDTPDGNNSQQQTNYENCKKQQLLLKVRIYTNILQKHQQFNNSNEMPLIVPRIAAKVTPNAYCNGIEMIELDPIEPPDMITCCQETGNILVKSKMRLYIYEYRECFNEQQHFQYIDFFELPIFIELNFLPTQIDIVENLIAAVSKKSCVVFKIADILYDSDDHDNNDDDGDGNANGGGGNDDDDDDDCGGCISLTTTTATEPTNSSCEIAGSGTGGYEYEINKYYLNENSLIDEDSLNNSNNSKENCDDTDSYEYEQNHQQLLPHLRNCIDFQVAIDMNIGYNRQQFDCNLDSVWQMDHEYDLNDTQQQKIHNKTTMNFHKIEDIPILTNDIKVKLCENQQYCEWSFVKPSILITNPIQIRKYEIKKLLQLQMASLKQNKIRICETFSCFDLKAIYKKPTNFNCDDDPNTKNDIKLQSNILKSKRYNNCIGFSFIITTTASDGYLYQFSNSGKWYTDNEKSLTKYQFTAPVLSIIITDFVVHAITRETIETVTSRIGHKLFSSYYEYPMLSKQFPYETSPTPDIQIYCMKLHSFINTRYCLSNKNNIILISTCPQDNKSINNHQYELSPSTISAEWTVYNLKMPDPIRLAEDLEQNAKETLNGLQLFENFTNLDLIYELLTESNIILRLAKYLDLNYCEKFVEKIDKMFHMNCKFLADLVIRSKKEDQFGEAIGYYQMCNISPYQIYETYFQNMQITINDKHKWCGLIHAMRLAVTCFAKKRPESEFLDEHHSIIFQHNDLMKLDKTIDTIPFGYELFRFFYIHDPESLSILGLKSMPFLDTNIVNYLQYFNLDTKRTRYDLLLNSLALCRNKCYNLALTQIEKITRHQIYESLKLSWHILFDDNLQLNDYKDQTFSEFTEKILFRIHNKQIIDGISDVFIYYLCILNKIDIKFIYDLFVNYFALNVENCKILNDNDNFNNTTATGIKNITSNNNIPRKICEIILGGYFYELFTNIDCNLIDNDLNGIPNNCNKLITSSITPPSINNSPEHNQLIPQLVNLDLIQHNDDSIIIDDCNIGNNCNMDLNTISSNSFLTTDDKTGNFHDEIAYQNYTIGGGAGAGGSLRTTVTSGTTTTATIDNPETKALILLLRLYLGNLAIATKKQKTNDDGNCDEDDKKLNEILIIRNQCINELIRNKTKFMKWTNDIDFKEISPKLIPNYDMDNNIKIESYIRPIACLDERPFYLNEIQPFHNQLFQNQQFIGYNDDVILWVLKVQCLLCSKKTDYIIPDFLSFIQKNLLLIGIDSFISILLPVEYGINFLMKISPNSLYNYGKYHRITDEEYRTILRNLMNFIRLPSHENIIITNMEYQKSLEYVLEQLFNDRTFESFLNCLPIEEVSIAGKHIYRNHTNDDLIKIFGYHHKNDDDLDADADDDDDTINLVMDSVDETNIFQRMLRKGVARQRSEALTAMIESTGKQLFEASKNA